MRKILLLFGLGLFGLSFQGRAQSFTPQVRQYIKDSAVKTAITDVTIYDGTGSAGKRADLVLIDGDLGKDIRAIRHTEIVFKGGVGFDSPKIFASVKGWVGIN